jgi:hypothetical protein
MRMVLLCAAALIPGLMPAQGQEPPLSYRGWALGISVDSATKLTKAQIGMALVCTADTQVMFCHTGPGRAPRASAYFGPEPRRLEDVSLAMLLDRRASRDSVARWFRTRWGAPIPREYVGKKSTSGSEVLGSWARDNMIFGNAGITSDDTTRVLYVSIASADRQMRLMEQQAESSAKRR